MNWVQISATVDASNTEALEEGLLAAGASAVTLLDAADQPIMEPALGTTPLWKDTTVLGLFQADEDIEEAKRISLEIYRNLSGDQAAQLNSEILENEDWTRKWIENFKPMQFGSRLWVCPSWLEQPDPNAVNLILDPGLAFGTGTHPTTALCLKWLDEQDLSGKTVVDYGCGSGILGIAALLLGAEKVYAIDNDPQALTATRDNAERNQIDANKVITLLPDEVGPIQADILIANILAQPLYALRDKMLSLLTAKGKLALSGVLDHQAAELNAYYRESAVMEEPVTQQEWARLSGCMKPA